jgi:tetratricopeptide (TPR) repeat protein
MMAYVAGFGGGRETGLEMLRATAASNTEARTDAMFALVLVYNRERRYDDALRVLDDLRRLYPRNRLVVLEAGSTAVRAGRGANAESMLTEGLAVLARETRPRIPGEEALWRYKRGLARAALGRIDAAREDLHAATGANAQAWVNGRARLELGRLALTRGDRGGAAADAREAQSLCARGNDPECVSGADKLLRSANGR